MVSPDVSHCDYCPYGGACGNVPSRPLNRIGNIKPSEIYSVYVEEAADKLGKSPYQTDGKVNNDCMNEAYMMMMRQALEEENDVGGDE